jgi:hypothetical protein
VFTSSATGTKFCTIFRVDPSCAGEVEMAVGEEEAKDSIKLWRGCIVRGANCDADNDDGAHSRAKSEQQSALTIQVLSQKQYLACTPQCPAHEWSWSGFVVGVLSE